MTTRILIALMVVIPLAARAGAGDAPDPRTVVRHLNTTYFMPVYSSRESWLQRREALRQQLRVSLGLYPWPERTPLHAKVFGRIERGDYSVDKVHFESLPGFYVAGNLYRPQGLGVRRPGILNPHGHWGNGRMADVELGSIAGRCIGQARLGYVAFTWDMVGYNDSLQIEHRSFQGAPLYGLSQMALQTWNSIRAIDFLQSLPDVDPNRIGVTGESGGGTQTFMLCAVDDRVQWASPVNMISCSMQGGCLCENAPGLRIGTNNMEIGALFAPKPLHLVSCTGDWTSQTPRIEYPSIREVYELLGAGDRVSYVYVDAAHNYNKASRESVYGFLAKWIDGRGTGQPLAERPFTKEPDATLRVFASKADLPAGAKTTEQVVRYWIEQSEAQLESARRAGPAKLREVYGPALRHALQMNNPARVGFSFSNVSAQGTIGHPPKTATVLVHPNGRKATQIALAQALVAQGHAVYACDLFNHTTPVSRPDLGFFTTYNRTDTAERVADILRLIQILRTQEKVATLNLVGVGEFGPLALLANAVAGDSVSRCAVDYAQFPGTDEAFTKQLFSPSLRRAGDLRVALALSATRPLLVHNAGNAQLAGWARGRRVQLSGSVLSDEAIVQWLAAR